jgi:hypothetical protein
LNSVNVSSFQKKTWMHHLAADILSISVRSVTKTPL